MPRRGLFAAVAMCIVVVVARLAAQQPSTVDNQKGWTLPAGSATEPNPIASSPEIVQKGQKLYQGKCQRCHGKEGKGDGPDADPDKPAGNLTDRVRAGFNPDGVVFYKIWNGRSSPKMAAFKSEGLSRDEVWTVVQYVKTLRK
jgi:mono/diheme cytochrome c family protein